MFPIICSSCLISSCLPSSHHLVSRHLVSRHLVSRHLVSHPPFILPPSFHLVYHPRIILYPVILSPILPSSCPPPFILSPIVPSSCLSSSFHLGSHYPLILTCLASFCPCCWLNFDICTEDLSEPILVKWTATSMAADA